MRMLLAVFAVLALTGVAHADPDESDVYIPNVAACIAAAADDEAALRACRGAAANPCLEAAGGITHYMVMCFSAEARGWGDAMDGAFARLAAARPETASALQEAHTAWEGYRDSECSYRVARWGEGSGARVELAACYNQLTTDRALALLVYERQGD